MRQCICMSNKLIWKLHLLFYSVFIQLRVLIDNSCHYFHENVKMTFGGQHCDPRFGVMPVLWNKYFFIKRCAFSSSTRICKEMLRLLRIDPLNGAKTVKIAWKKLQKSSFFSSITGQFFFQHIQLIYRVKRFVEQSLLYHLV